MRGSFNEIFPPKPNLTSGKLPYKIYKESQSLFSEPEDIHESRFSEFFNRPETTSPASLSEKKNDNLFVDSNLIDSHLDGSDEEIKGDLLDKFNDQMKKSHFLLQIDKAKGLNQSARLSYSKVEHSEISNIDSRESKYREISLPSELPNLSS